jgi:multiple sugar transport system permease protein
VATWTGWFCLVFAIYRGIEVLTKPKGVARSRTVRGFVNSALGCSFGFIIAAAMPMDSGQKLPGLKLPIIWPIMPFAAWATLICVVFAVYRAYQLVVDKPVNPDPNTQAQVNRYRGWIRQAIFSLVLGGIFFFIFKKSGDTVDIIKGGIPFSLNTAIAVVLLAVVATILMAVGARRAGSRGLAKTVITQIALLIGSIVFGLPFLWLVITSFKEDVDMSSANGLVWIPKVTEQVNYRDPDNPYYEATFQDTTVEADRIDIEPNGKYKLNVAHPMSLQGATFEAAPNEVKEIDRLIDVVSGTYHGQAYVGKALKTLPDGHKIVQITSPASLMGVTYTANPADVQPVRHDGLKISNYKDSLEYLPVEAHNGLTYLANTLIIVFFSIIGTLLSSSIVAYAFARLTFPGKGVLFTILISTMMLPAAVTLLPTFLIFRAMGMIDTLTPLWLPSFFAGAFNVFLLRQFFMQIPKELEDASKIDGCNHIKTYWTVMLPQIKPAMAVIFIWTFLGVWNNFMGPLVYINSPEHMPISYALQLFQGERSGEPGLLMAFATMSMLPVLLLFFFAQRYFIEGVTLSGLGGR